MDIEILDPRRKPLPSEWKALLKKAGLTPDAPAETTVLIWVDDELAATGSRDGDLIKYMAVDPLHRGEDLTATLLTQLRQDAFAHGKSHLFLYTKPKNRLMFQDLFFYPVAQTQDVLLMEDRRDGLKNYVSGLPRFPEAETVGAAVMHCNPFTRGHRYLIETAAKDCDRLYVFVLSEDRGLFPAADRIELVRQGTADLPNVTVLPTGPYLISAATFPTYFLQSGADTGAIQCQLDVEIFAGKVAPALGITRRYVGTEPLSAVTDAYNRVLLSQLPQHGIEVHEIPRIELDGAPISASRVRALLQEGRLTETEPLVPPTTFAYLQRKEF